MLPIAGIQKLSLLDYEGMLSAILFTQGCVFRCGYCYNPELVLPSQFKKPYEHTEVMDFLHERKDKLDAVVITGGEPTLHKNLSEFIISIRSLGYKIKLDTNGIFPDRLKNILDQNIVDYVAMDIKAPFEKYGSVTGRNKLNYDVIKKSISVIMNSGVDYEFRSTIIAGIHSIDDVKEMAQLIRGAKKYFLQKFVPHNVLVNQEYGKFKCFPDRDMELMKQQSLHYVQNCSIR